MSRARSTAVSLYDSEHSESDVRAAFTSGAVPVAVYGLGKMGLPLAAVYADVTRNVTGVDVDTSVVAQITAGACPVEGEPGLPALVTECVDTGALTAPDGTGSRTTDRPRLTGHSVSPLVVPRVSTTLGLHGRGPIDAPADDQFSNESTCLGVLRYPPQRCHAIRTIRARRALV